MVKPWALGDPMIRHGRASPFRADDGGFPRLKEKPIDHLDILRKFVYQLEVEDNPERRARLESIIETYGRMYVKA